VLKRETKAAFFLFAGPFMRVNAWIYRRFRNPLVDLKVQLGPGQRKYLDGWINVDANMFTGKCDIWADLRYTLPFVDNTIDALYSHHVVEHLPNLSHHFSDAYRCLKPGGVYRVGVPNGDSAIAKFIENDHDWFSDFPDRRSSIGGRLDNFVLCKNEHLVILTWSYLEELMTGAGFRDLGVCIPSRETNYPELFAKCLSMEPEVDFEAPHTLIIEGVKPL
jgi:predicted SAM-dependent methyltransferase